MAPATPPPDPARDVALRFDRWFDAHGLDLPAETRAQFVEMGVEALERWPGREPDTVLDELIAELDDRLGRIVDETTARHEGFAPPSADAHALPGAAAPPTPRPPGPLARFFGRRDRRH